MNNLYDCIIFIPKIAASTITPTMNYLPPYIETCQ